MMLLFLLSLFTFSANVQDTYAQSNVSCLPFYNWTSNSQGQTPCQVASSLLAICNNATFPVEPLPDSSHYLGPSLQDANACQCSTVTYSLMSACGACQGRTYLSWSVWSEDCPTVYISSFPEPLPAGVAVPGWAYLDVTAEDNFDQTNAKKDSNATESTAVPSPTSSSSGSPAKTSSVPLTASSHPITPSAVPSVSASVSASTSSTQAFSEKRANAVGGGVIGGLFGVVIIFASLYWYIYRRRRLARNGQQLPSPADPENASWHGQGPYMAQRQVADPVVQTSTAPSSNNSIQHIRIIHTYHSSNASADTVPKGTATS
ncbi:hypothetical protein CPB84DRAFT_1957623 [Gymnopilus junonius]|uniref:Uncharacterized protein n=1 Tax=Gymnopilus junonius TaxID=109634 RepID=A0A9P5P0T2_GYMJU|nr:hypothetical protein CPB84DRAFT_1957623 [Gymnopilus junonius]